MQEVGAFEAKNRLGALLDRVEQARRLSSLGAANLSPSWFRRTQGLTRQRLVKPSPD
jgi:hypothetical protein